MKKYIEENSNIPIEYRMLSYKGIGGFKKGSNARNTKAEQLLTDLPKRIKAFDAMLRHKTDAVLFIIVDNDQRDAAHFQEELDEIARREAIMIDHVFCIAVEEIEAWLLGDFEAIKAGYPKLVDRITSKHSNYKQDSICGTWEVLADMLNRKGLGDFLKQNPTVFDVGRCKSEWAENIGKHINIRNNVSPSFRRMIAQLDLRASVS
jgi:PII-like signaling protein